MKMICRQCHTEYDGNAGPTCPECGATGLLKTSTIRISMGSTDAVYHSLSEVPARLRGRLIKSTSGVNSGTILIADSHGRDEILRALRRLPTQAERGLVQSILGEQAPGGEPAGPAHPVRRALAWMALAACLVIAWIVLTRRWF
jgi:hypothetical protein